MTVAIMSSDGLFEMGGGLIYRDVVSGFEGKAIGYAEYVYEGPSVLIVGVTKQAAAESRWISAGRLELVSPGSTGFSG